jgi:hypothetical protein
MFRPTITDMQGKYCGDRATSFVVSFVLALNRVSIEAVTTILALYVGNGRSEHM